MTDEEIQEKVFDMTNTLLRVISESENNFLIIISSLSSAILTICNAHGFDKDNIKKLLDNMLLSWEKGKEKEKQMNKRSFKKVKNEKKDAF